MPGYCGPNPIVRPDGNINFSYGLTDLYQTAAIAAALPNSGSGLRVTGYNFGFTAKNGNGWDDGRVDTLAAYVSLYDKQGKAVEYHNYDLNYQFNWTTFSLSETFSSSYAASDLSSVRYGFVGKDNNYWAGPYGPEIQNVSFSLNYSVDPCAVDIMSSPSCPGYLDAIVKLTTPVETLMVEVAPVVSQNSPNLAPVEQPVQQTVEKKAVTPRLSVRQSSRDAEVVNVAVAVAMSSAQKSVEESAAQNQLQLDLTESTQKTLKTINSGLMSFQKVDVGQNTAQNTNIPDVLTSSQSKNDGLDVKDLTAAPVQQQPQGNKERPMAKNPAPIAEFGPVSAGFTAYTTVALTDGIFYAPKAIYKGQKTVDNTRALRQLGSDDLHQRMIEMQYGR